MEQGWPASSRFCALYLTHFRGMPCAPAMVMGRAKLGAEAWKAVTGPLRLAGVKEGQDLESSPGVPPLGGTVEGVSKTTRSQRAAAARHTSTVPPSGGTPGGAFQVCPSLTPASLSGPVTAFHASAAELCATAITIAGAHGMPRKVREVQRRILKMLASPAPCPELAIPVVRAREETVHDANDARPAGLGFDDPLVAIGGEPGAASPSAANRCGGSQMVIFATRVHSGAEAQREGDRLATLFREHRRHEPREIPAPVAIARQTSSGVPGTSTSDLDRATSRRILLEAHDGTKASLDNLSCQGRPSRRASAVSLAQPDLLVKS